MLPILENNSEQTNSRQPGTNLHIHKTNLDVCATKEGYNGSYYKYGSG